MNAIDLLKLGLNKNEAEVYLSLVRFREADANHLIKDTKFHKKIVYDNLQRLMDKGLITGVIKDGRKLFLLSMPHMLSSYIDEQKKELEEKEKIAVKLENEIEKMARIPLDKQEATLYSGKQAVKAFYAETLKNGDYYVIGAPKISVEIMGELFWETHHMKRKAENHKAYLILNESLKEWSKKVKDNYTEVKYLSKGFEPQTETHIQENVVAIIVWTYEPVIFKMHSKTVAESYKKYFNLLWKQAQT